MSDAHLRLLIQMNSMRMQQPSGALADWAGAISNGLQVLVGRCESVDPFGAAMSVFVRYLVTGKEKCAVVGQKTIASVPRFKVKLGTSIAKITFASHDLSGLIEVDYVCPESFCALRDFDVTLQCRYAIFFALQMIGPDSDCPRISCCRGRFGWDQRRIWRAEIIRGSSSSIGSRGNQHADRGGQQISSSVEGQESTPLSASKRCDVIPQLRCMLPTRSINVIVSARSLAGWDRIY